MNLNTLEPGQTLFEKDLEVTVALVSHYVDAVADDAGLYAEDGVVPPLAVIAHIMALTMEAVALPSGAVHTGQEMVSIRPVPTGSLLRCSAVVSSNSVRHGTRFLVLDLRGGHQGLSTVEGRTTIAVTEDIG